MRKELILNFILKHSFNEKMLKACLKKTTNILAIHLKYCLKTNLIIKLYHRISRKIKKLEGNQKFTTCYTSS